jgi:NADH:ubiquinone oxidoreductase subunit 6 (subunit J)
MTISVIVFYFFVLTALISALGILLSRHVFKSALMLLSCLLSIAALYVLSFAEFVAVTQILIYAGGVTVLIIFGIMLTTTLSGKPLEVENTNIFLGVSLSILLAGILINLFLKEEIFAQNQRAITSTIPDIGVELMTTFSLPFEVSGILLLIALVGASVLTSFLKEKKW